MLGKKKLIIIIVNNCTLKHTISMFVDCLFFVYFSNFRENIRRIIVGFFLWFLENISINILGVLREYQSGP